MFYRLVFNYFLPHQYRYKPILQFLLYRESNEIIKVTG